MHLVYTLEHAFPQILGFAPILPVGKYKCVRGPHELEGMTETFETFEITGVLKHSGLLFHWGNYNKDTNGCVLVGLEESDTMILHSRDAFDTFMGLLKDQDSFTLVVQDE